MFSIVIPTHNRISILRRSLPYVLGMRGAGDCEILVVDDGSSDGTGEFLASEALRSPNLKPIRLDSNMGAGRARNWGLQRAAQDRLLFLDDDIFPDPGLAEAHWRRLDSDGDVSQGRMVWAEELAGQELIKFMDARGMQFRLDSYADGERISYQHVYTANLALLTADAREVSGFDDIYDAEAGYGFEDTAMAWKLDQAGRRIRYTPAAWAWHYHPMTEEKLLKREYSVGYSMALTRKFNPVMAADLGFDRIMRGGGWKLAALKLINGSGLPGLLGRDLRRRLNLKQAFLSGAREGLKGCEEN